ncbi:MAG TPA: hypothetical protein ENL27_01970, partial [Candidatus Parcubacteria bacterium]|nr:hypothetical protein [Candidatus Parcubacteria bacterium]
MKRNGKWTTLLISIFVSLVFFWSANILAKEVEDFYFWHQVTSNPSILTAQADEILISKKLKEARRERRIKNNLKNLKLDAKAAISVEFDSDGNEKILFERNINERLPIA